MIMNATTEGRAHVRQARRKLGARRCGEPLGFVDGMNLYQYVRSNPANLLDPLGLAAVVPQVQFMGVTVTRIEKRKDMPGNTPAGFTKPKISSMQFTVEGRGDKCWVVIESVEWRIESTRYRDEYVFNDQAPFQYKMWDWSDYEKVRGLSDKEWYGTIDYSNWQAVEAHEDAHVEQYKAVGRDALAEYVKNYNANPKFGFDNPHSAMDQANTMSGSDSYWLDASNALVAALIAKYGKFGVGKAGEEGATNAERKVLESQYQEYLRKQR